MDTVRSLVEIVGRQHVLTDPDLIDGYATDWTGRFVGETAVVVRPGTTAEVAAIVDVCRSMGHAIVPQGGNTGLVGGSVPLGGEIVLSTRRLAGVHDVDVVGGHLVAGAGTTLAEVQAAAAGAGRRYAVDMGSRGSATIGGTVATNAGGLNLLRYGGTREQVVGVEVVLGNGAVVSALGGLAKDNTGYHLPSLMCGSEGTLGVVTAVRVNMVAASPHRATALVAMSDLPSAVHAVALWRSELPELEAAELMLADGLSLVANDLGVSVPFEGRHGVHVLVEVAAVDDPTDRLLEALSSTADVRDAVMAADDRQRAELWRLREEHTAAINRIGPPHKFDVTLPLDALDEFVDRVRSIIAVTAPGAHGWIFGHLGDGNLHLNVTGVGQHNEAVDDAVLGLVVDMSGSISAEHGIGTAKAKYLRWQRSAAEIETMRAIRHALDPDRIMNPAVLFDW